MSGEKKEKTLPPHKEVACRITQLQYEKTTPGNTPKYYNAFPRDCKFTYMTPGYYATGFRILDVYKTEVDFTEMRRLLFLEDPMQVNKWGALKSRIPYPESRVTDLPGTRKVDYHKYCLRSLTPESAMSWRKSVIQSPSEWADPNCENQNEGTDCVCEED